MGRTIASVMDKCVWGGGTTRRLRRVDSFNLVPIDIDNCLIEEASGTADKLCARHHCRTAALRATATESKLEEIEVSRMLDALRGNEAMMDATLIQAHYQVDPQAVAEAIIARAHMLRHLRDEFSREGDAPFAIVDEASV